ncbi:Toll/interleukin-1 receptor domain-containing protein [Tanacetum coccineum]
MYDGDVGLYDGDVGLELPELPDTFKDTFCFSAPPTSPDCMVVGNTIGSGSPYCIHIVGGEPSWRRTPLKILGDDCFTSITFYGRDLYALRGDGGFDIFKEMGRENHKWWRDVAKAPARSVPQCFQLRCDQHILRVIVGRFGESVEVFKITRSRKWAKTDTLGKHMIFISGASSVCLDAKTPQMANKIYFPSSPIMYYSIETCRFHTLNNEDSFGDFFGTKHHLTSHGWIEPRWS